MSSPESHRRTVTVLAEHGLHLGPCSKVAQAAQKFASKVTLEKGATVADAKSVLDLMTLAADHGTKLIVVAVGADAAQAVQTLGDLFDSGLTVVAKR